MATYQKTASITMHNINMKFNFQGELFWRAHPANTFPRKMAQMDAAQKVLQALGYMTKHCVKDMRKRQHN